MAMIRRSDLQKKQYRENPYFKDLTNEELSEELNKWIAENIQPGDGSKIGINQDMETFTHILEECSRRGIDIQDLKIHR